MNHVSKLLAMLVVVALVGVTYAAESSVKSSKHPVIRGTIVSVDVEAKSFVIKTLGRDTKDVTVTTDDATKITLDQQLVTLADLKAGYQVTVAPETGVATRVEARTAAVKHKSKHKEKKAQ